MGSRETCPACRARTSDVFFAFQRGEECPNCGLPAGVAAKVLEVQRRHASAELLGEYNAMAARALSAEQQVRVLTERLYGIRDLANEPLPEGADA